MFKIVFRHPKLNIGLPEPDFVIDVQSKGFVKRKSKKMMMRLILCMPRINYKIIEPYSEMVTLMRILNTLKKYNLPKFTKWKYHSV